MLALSGRGDLGGAVDAGADADIGRAAAQVAGHRVVDLGVGRFRMLLQQGAGAHDLARLAIAALRHVEFLPGLLQRVLVLLVQALRWS
jgi:hypothetical protein